jgi:L-ascorbate metabolism protein UlaG (beta-lactamase superfamily)
MLFSSKVTVDLNRIQPRFPWTLIYRFMAARFDRARCQALLDERIAAGVVHEPWLRSPRLDDDGPLLADEGLFALPESRWGVSIKCYSDRQRSRLAAVWEAELDEDSLPSVTAMLRDGLRGDDPALFRAEHDDLPPQLLDVLMAEEPELPIVWPVRRTPGLYRHEHASLLFVSETTSLLIDPLSPLLGLSGLQEVAAELSGSLDAIAITHSHGDHWHLPSLLTRLPAAETPVLVPSVPRVNVLTPIDFARDLTLAGHAGARPVGWGETIRIGDIEIDVLPFFGEQPTRDAPGAPAGVRSYGNCYRIQTPQLSAIVLVDSGADPDGSMIDVLAQSRLQRGPCDVVLSCLREFASPFFGGLITYWPTLSFARLSQLYRELQTNGLPFTTAGPVGMAQACRAVGAAYALGYAHGFNGMGNAIEDIGWGGGEPSERAATIALARELQRLGAVTKALDWRCGDGFHLTNGRARLSRVVERRRAAVP